ncbi:hypothetical protein BDW02DRAFT_53827 [Decorospora gaudefroyi]|uniref:PhoD-like phosphatase domain-containing protein n=1 Tax=Decorospora gaudefroyi TaxID=184978 RepID=A0A6A5KTA6_9PLEO|nr:hypothetical protein BDW02DRAFT_53827 [Decorospora gaudefroyi]
MAAVDEYQHHEDPSGVTGIGQGPQLLSTSDALDVIMGPLLNYRRTSNQENKQPIWHGSVLIVTTPGQRNPELVLSPAGAVDMNVVNPRFTVDQRTFHGDRLYEDPKRAFWRFIIDAPMQEFESRWTYEIRNLEYVDRHLKEKPQTFAIPSIHQSMRIMFHSCNGFSVGTDVDAWSGPALWNDVLRMHEQRPFHIMIGGGDQIYNDSVRVDGPLKPWTDISSPHKRREFPFDENMRQACDEYYVNNYIKWYGQKPFSTANGQIPQVNIWDDHDIIDGFGSYTDHFMNCAVFRGIGGVAHKYYLLFQHHLAPPKSTFTTDAPKTTEVSGTGHGTTPADPVQMQSTFVMTDDAGDSSYIIGAKPGPYVEERSRSIYCQLGARIAFVGVDARTERTRHQINYPDTYTQIFDRVDKEFTANPDLKHLILLLGVPIAYPRLIWLENILQSPLIAPIKFLNKRFGFAGGFFNQFDGKVDLLDDLDDHYTARQHKDERRKLILRLQKIAQKYSARVTILGGDVHLAAVGRFYTNPKHQALPAEQDWRYMPNIISSAITNKPPPQAVANLLARRNKIHHLDHETDETLLEIFDRDPALPDGINATNGSTPPQPINGDGKDGKIEPKTSSKNHATMPSRNYAIICESGPTLPMVAATTTGASTLSPADATTTTTTTAAAAPSIHTNGDSAASHVSRTPTSKDNMRHPFSNGEMNAGTQHPAAGGIVPTGLGAEFGLDVTLRVEVSNRDPMGRTDGYGFSIPALSCEAYRERGERW